MAEKEESTQLEWYVVHTYSGYENKVKANLEMTVQNRGMQELITEVKIPMEEVLMPTFRPPTKPISMGALADAYLEGLEGGAEE